MVAVILGSIIYFLTETTCLPTGEVGVAIEQLKNRYLHMWIEQCSSNHPLLYTRKIFNKWFEIQILNILQNKRKRHKLFVEA